MNILIIRPGAIGDTLLTFPILGALQRKYHGPHITFVGNAAVLPLVLEAGLANEVSDYQLQQWSELFSTDGIQEPALLGLLQGTDLAICWLRDPDHLVRQNLRQAGVKQLIIAPGRPPAGERIHIVEYLARTARVEAGNIDIIRRGEGGGEVRGGPLWSPAGGMIESGHFMLEDAGDHKGPPHRSTPPSPLRQVGQTAVPEIGLDVYQPIAIHPGSGGARKCWPIEKFAAVIEHLWQQGWPVLVLIGPADAAQLHYLQRHLHAPELLTLAVNAPLIEVARRLQGCRCYLGNDSGVTHLAALLGLPTVALFGPSDPATWHPVGRLVSVLYEPDLANLPVATVIAQIEKQISIR